MDFVRSLDHTSIAVDRIPLAVPLFRDLLGGTPVGGGDDGPYRWLQFQFPGGGKIEVLDPTGPESFVRRFLDHRGAGVHHITFKVHDIAAAMAAAEAAGFPVFGFQDLGPGWKEAFIHPRHAHGVLIQLAQSDHDEGDGSAPAEEEDARKILAEPPS